MRLFDPTAKNRKMKKKKHTATKEKDNRVIQIQTEHKNILVKTVKVKYCGRATRRQQLRHDVQWFLRQEQAPALITQATAMKLFLPAFNNVVVILLRKTL